MRAALLLLSCLALGACSVAALPFKLVGDVVEVIPVIGGPVGGAIHGIGTEID